MLAVPASGLRVRGARSVIVAGAAPKAGEETLFSRPVLSAAAFVRRDGTVLADAWLPDLVRLGVLEAHLGDGVIEKIVEKGLRNGRLPLRERRRLLSYPLVIRLVIAMTLLPGSSYAEAMRTVAGLLADIPFTLGWHVPTGKSIGEWRMLVPPEIMQEVFWHTAGALIGDDEPSAVMLCRIVRGFFVGAGAASPDLWGFCGDAAVRETVALEGFGRVRHGWMPVSGSRDRHAPAGCGWPVSSAGAGMAAVTVRGRAPTSFPGKEHAERRIGAPGHRRTSDRQSSADQPLLRRATRGECRPVLGYS